MLKSDLTCEKVKILMMGLLDNELDSRQELEINAHLAGCPSCSEQYQSFKELKEGASEMKFKQLPEMYWDEYWNQVYNRIERGFGWILLSLGLIFILIFAGYQLLQTFFLDPAKPFILKLGVGLGGIGLSVLFVSVLREKLMVRKVDKYRSLKR